MIDGEVKDLLSRRQQLLACFVFGGIGFTSLFSSSSSHSTPVPGEARRGQFGQSNSTEWADWLHIDSICPFACSAAFEISRGTRKAEACKVRMPAASADLRCMMDVIEERYLGNSTDRKERKKEEEVKRRQVLVWRR